MGIQPARPERAAQVTEGGKTDTGEVTRRILAAYEAGDLVTSCAWCKRILLDGEWLLAPRAAISAIDAPHSLSHSICPDCAVSRSTSAAKPKSAAPLRPRR